MITPKNIVSTIGKVEVLAIECTGQKQLHVACTYLVYVVNYKVHAAACMHLKNYMLAAFMLSSCIYLAAACGGHFNIVKFRL